MIIGTVLRLRHDGPTARAAILLGPWPPAERVAFTDLADDVLELMLSGVAPDAVTAWVDDGPGRATVTRSATALAVVGARLPDPARRAGYADDLFALSSRAHEVLRSHPGPRVPEPVVVAEVVAVHERAGNPDRSLSWHIRWIAAITSGVPVRPPDPAVLRTARLAHGQWLRLSGGRVDPVAEVATLRAAGSGPTRS